MAVLIRELDNKTDSLELSGVVYQGEFYGDEDLADNFAEMTLDQPGMEQALADRFNSRLLNAEMVADDEVDIDRFRDSNG